MVVKGTAEFEFSAHKNKSIMKNIVKENAGYRKEVINALINQFELLNIL